MGNKTLLSQRHGVWIIKGNTGSGKTRLLLDNVFQAVESGNVPADSIMFLSCKPSQQQSIKEECASRLPVVDRVKVLNFIDLARQIVHANPALSTKSKSDILSADRFQNMRHFVVHKALGNCVLPPHLESWKTSDMLIRNIIDVIKFEQTMSPLRRDKLEPWVRNVIVEYEKICRENAIVFQEDLIMQAINILKKKAADAVLPKFAHIVVDDFQEINCAYYELLRQLLHCMKQNKSFKNALFSVNDSFSIHTYRGASMEYIKKAQKEFSVSVEQIISLNANKSSIQTIVHSLVLPVKQQPTEQGQQYLSTGDGPIWCIETKKYLDQIYYCAKQIKTLLLQGVSPAKIGIIFEGIYVEAHLCKSVFDAVNIPSVFEKGIPVQSSVSCKFLLLCAQMKSSQYADSQLKRFLTGSVLGVNSIETSRIAAESRRRKIPLKWGIIRYAEFISDPCKRKRMLDMLFYLMRSDRISLLDFFTEIIHRSALSDFLLTQNQWEKESIRRIMDSAAFFVQLYSRMYDGAKPTAEHIEHFEKWCMPEYIKDKQANNTPAVKILTTFVCDSYEFDHIFVLGCDEKRYPDSFRSFVPVLLQNSTAVMASKKRFELQDRVLLINALNRASQGAFLLFSRDAGEPSPLLSVLNQHPQVTERIEDFIFGEYSDASNVLNREDAALWMQHQTAGLDTIGVTQLHKACEAFLPDVSAHLKPVLANAAFTLAPHYTFSASGIDSFLRCPRRYFFTKIMRIDRDEDSEGLIFGQVVHRVLEIFHTLYPVWTSREEFNKIENECILRKILERELAHISELNRFNRAILEYEIFECIKNYNDYLETQVPITICALEKRISFLLDSIPFSISIDRIDSKPANPHKVRIVDYKTKVNKSAKRAQTLRNEFLGLSELTFKGTKSCQLPLYYFAARYVLNLDPDALSIFYLRTHPANKPSYCHNVSLTVDGALPKEAITLDDLQTVRGEIGEIVDLIKSGYFPLPKAAGCYNCFSPTLCMAQEPSDAT